MITLPKYETSGGGYGSYYELSATVGVKVLHRKNFKSMKKALNSRLYREAMKESELLCMAFESGVVPRCYGVTLVKDDEGYGVGILMQHLGNKTLRDKGDRTEAYDTIQDALEEVGLRHLDLHRGNMMVYRGKYYAIDFSPDFIETLEDK